MDFVKREKDWITVAKEAFKLQQQARELEKAKEQAFKKLKEVSGEQNCKGGGFVYSFSLRKGNVDIEKIAQEYSLNLEPYRKPESKVWKLEMQLMEV